MPEAEVSLRLAFYLLSKPNSSGSASIAIDGAQVRCADQEIFPIEAFLRELNWLQIGQVGGNAWHGTYKKRGGRVCLDSLKQFLSGKLLCLMPLPVSAVV